MTINTLIQIKFKPSHKHISIFGTNVEITYDDYFIFLCGIDVNKAFKREHVERLEARAIEEVPVEEIPVG